MLLRIALFIVMAAGLLGFGTVVFLTLKPSASPASPVAVAQPPVTVRVLAAGRTLRAGSLLKPEDLAAVSLAPGAVPAGARTDTPAAHAELLGAMLRRSMAAGEVVLPADVVRAGDRGFLAAVLQPGMRAATVGVDAISGTAGLIWPGDHVDLILTETIEDSAAPLGHRIAGETVLHNLRVIATDQELMQGATPGAMPTNPGSSPGRTVTLEVSPENAERVAVATRLGHLSLSVIAADRPAAEPKPVRAEAEPVTWGGDVSAALQTDTHRGAATATVKLFEGNSDGKEFHF